jgi:hypothetical protein
VVYSGGSRQPEKEANFTEIEVVGMRAMLPVPHFPGKPLKGADVNLPHWITVHRDGK